MSENQKRPIDLLYEKIEATGLDSLTEPERWMSALTWLGLETTGGGLHQFFFNDAGKFRKPQEGEDAAPSSRPPSQLSTSPDAQTPDSLRGSSSGGCG